MSKIGIFMANGCEEIEGLTVVDMVRRAGLEIDMISITEEKQVTGAHGIVFMADITKAEADFNRYDGIVLPGGMPGTTNLGADETVDQVIREFAAKGKMVAAICAAPSVLGLAGLLDGKMATSYPGFEEKLIGAEYLEAAVVADENIITSRGMGTAIAFSSEIIRYFTDDETAENLQKAIIYKELAE